MLRFWWLEILSYFYLQVPLDLNIEVESSFKKLLQLISSLKKKIKIENIKLTVKTDPISEADIMQNIMGDVLRSIIPQFYGVTMLNNLEFIRMEHLTQNCPDSGTSIMDIKLGSKTYLRSEENTKQRRDLYQKVSKKFS